MLCGDHNPLSLRLDFRPDAEGGVRADLRGGARMQGYDGILHGGVVAALLDAAMTHCLFHHGVAGLTAELRVRYLKPVPCDATLEARAWLDRARPPLYRLGAELTRDGQVLARAEASFLRRAAAAGV